MSYRLVLVFMLSLAARISYALCLTSCVASICFSLFDFCFGYVRCMPRQHVSRCMGFVLIVFVQEWAGNGAMVGAIKGCTGVEPTIVGKPSPLMIDYIVEKYSVER